MVIDIRELLAKAASIGWTDQQIMRAAGIKSYVTLYRWRKGTYYPRLKQVMMLQKALSRKP